LTLSLSQRCERGAAESIVGRFVWPTADSAGARCGDWLNLS